ncbi:MAG: sialidase family protein [Candidatus Latescibacterota bacterium]
MPDVRSTARARPRGSLRVEVGAPRPLAERPGGFPSARVLGGWLLVGASTAPHRRIGAPELLRFRDHLRAGGGLSPGELEAAGIPPDIHLGRGHWAIQSADGGDTWTPVADPITATFLSTCHELRDGSWVCLYLLSLQPAEGEELLVWRRPHPGASWSGPHAARVTGPRHADTGWDNPYLGGAFYGGLEELEDGSLLLFGHTRFVGDRSSRVVVYRSVDRAESFHYWATVAYEEGPSSPLRPIGFNEPGVVRAADGDLLCFLRTAEYEPICLSRSRNDGRTWSPPERVGVDGILPTPVRLDSGVLALSYGRPGVWVAFSADHGRWWSDRRCLWAWHGLWGQGHLPTTPHYTAPGYATFERSDCNARLCRVGPDRLLAVYGAPPPESGMEPLDAQDAGARAACRIWGVTLSVRLE